MDGVNKNKIERLFSETIAFRIRLKGTQFYGKITLLISNQDSVKKKLFLIDKRRDKMVEYAGKCLCGDVTLRVKGEPVMQGNCHCTDCKKTQEPHTRLYFFSRMSRSVF